MIRYYKGYSIELIEGTVEPLYQIYDKEGNYKGQGHSIKECREFINDYLLN